MRTLVAYVPVLHEGYRKFFTKYKGQKELLLFGPQITAEFPWLKKEIRELDPKEMQRAIGALKIFKRVRLLDKKIAKKLNSPKIDIALPDEDVSREIAQKYFPNARTTFDPIFLRWDKHASQDEKPVLPNDQITSEEFHRHVLHATKEEAKKSSDIWRRVGGAIVKEGEIILIGHNRHIPSQHSPFVHGDPRNNFKKGDHIEIATGFHVEASLVAEAARRGISLEGAAMYVTTFPCPPCAKVVAHSGIKTLYFGSGYGVLDGEDVLKRAGVKLIYVD